MSISSGLEGVNLRATAELADRLDFIMHRMQSFFVVGKGGWDDMQHWRENDPRQDSQPDHASP
jgi:hypothetical protein